MLSRPEGKPSRAPNVTCGTFCGGYNLITVKTAVEEVVEENGVLRPECFKIMTKLKGNVCFRHFRKKVSFKIQNPIKTLT